MMSRYFKTPSGMVFKVNVYSCDCCKAVLLFNRHSIKGNLLPTLFFMNFPESNIDDYILCDSRMNCTEITKQEAENEQMILELQK